MSIYTSRSTPSSAILFRFSSIPIFFNESIYCYLPSCLSLPPFQDLLDPVTFSNSTAPYRLSMRLPSELPSTSPLGGEICFVRSCFIYRSDHKDLRGTKICFWGFSVCHVTCRSFTSPSSHFSEDSESHRSFTVQKAVSIWTGISVEIEPHFLNHTVRPKKRKKKTATAPILGDTSSFSSGHRHTSCHLTLLLLTPPLHPSLRRQPPPGQL